MAYFNHAFQKLLLGTDPKLGGANYTNGWYTGAQGAITTGAIAAGCIAPVTATPGNGSIGANVVLDGNAAVPAIAAVPQIYLAQGSINTTDRLGPFAGGYQESVKTKGINPRYVTKFWKQCPLDPQAEVVDVCICEGAEPQCGTSYYLRIDIKGSPALRFLSHNAYKTLSSSNYCCPADPLAATALSVADSFGILVDWAWQILFDPWMGQFIAPELISDAGTWTWNDIQTWWADNGGNSVNLANKPSKEDLYQGYLDEVGTPGNLTGACILLYGAYVDTQFGTCSFHPQDHYELEPVKIYASITDQLGDPCVDQIFCIEKTQLAQQGSGYGHRYIRDLILFRRYMQENYVYDPRLREVMDQDVITNSGLVPTNQYTEYNVLHSVPRFNNPTGVFDNDQYLITMVFPCENTDFETWMQAYINLGGNGVTMESINGGSCPCIS
jgi:hypothetical protein